MEYNNFIKEVVEELKKFYGKDYEVEVTEQDINYDTSYDGLVIINKNGNTSPVFHLTDLYNRMIWMKEKQKFHCALNISKSTTLVNKVLK